MADKKPKKNQRTRRLATRPKFTLRSLLVFITIFAVVGGYILWLGFAASPPAVYLAPASQTNGPLTNFTVQVRENSGTTPVNAVQANLSYPAGLVDFVSISITGSAFATQAQASGGAGVVNIGLGTCGGCAGATGDQLVATITFKTKSASGAAAMAFTSGTALVDASTNADILGSLAATAGGTYTVDASAPTTSLTSPAAGASLAQGTIINVTASATDASAISKVEFYIDTALAGTVTTSTSGSYVYAWNTSGLSLGSHSLQAKAYDVFNNSASTSLISVTLADTTAPAAPLNFRTTSNSLTGINLAWNASTDNISVVSYKLKRAGNLIATVTAPTLTYNDTGLATGTSYSYTVQAADNAGNISTATSLTSSTASAVPGDVNGDGHVTIVDLSIMLSKWNTADAASDLNHDGIVSVLDLSVLLSHYGS